MQGESYINSYALLFTTSTAASINLCCIVVFNWVSAWLVYCLLWEFYCRLWVFSLCFYFETVLIFLSSCACVPVRVSLCAHTCVHMCACTHTHVLRCVLACLSCLVNVISSLCFKVILCQWLALCFCHTDIHYTGRVPYGDGTAANSDWVWWQPHTKNLPPSVCQLLCINFLHCIL